MPQGEARRAVVIGGGLAGLAAAARLCEAGWRVKVLEKDGAIGGRCRSVRSGDFLFDTGAQHFHDSFDDTLGAAIKNGLGAGFRIPLEKKGIVHDGELVEFVPRDLNPLALLPWKAMGRAGTLNVLGVGARLVSNYRSYNLRFPFWWKSGDDIAAIDFLSRRTTETFRRGVAEPAALYAMGADLHDISAAAFLVGLRYTFGDRTGGFVEGMGSLAEALAAGPEVLTGMEAVEVLREGGKAAGVKAVPADGGRSRTFRADAVVCALPAGDVPGVCGRLGRAARRLVDEIEYRAAVTVNVAIEGSPAPGGPVLLPRCEGFTASWCCTSASKAAEYAPAGSTVLTAVFCGSDTPHVAEEPDSALLKSAIVDVGRCFHLGKVEPLAWRVDRHEIGRPVMGPGHAARVSALRLEGSGTRGMALAGDWTMSPTVEGAIASGMWAAESLLAEGDGRQ